MSTYCTIAADHPVHGPYHDLEYGFPVEDDNLLFERLIMEINQAGLSWETILKKRDGLREAYAQFDVDAVAQFDEDDRARLLADLGIIRNRLKVNAAIENARRIVEIRSEYGRFGAWLDHHHPLSKSEWLKLFKKNFRFVGGEIVGEFLTSTGYLPGAHHEDCPVYARVLRAGPAWSRAETHQ